MFEIELNAWTHFIIICSDAEDKSAEEAAIRQATEEALKKETAAQEEAAAEARRKDAEKEAARKAKQQERAEEARKAKAAEEAARKVKQEAAQAEKAPVKEYTCVGGEPTETSFTRERIELECNARTFKDNCLSWKIVLEYGTYRFPGSLKIAVIYK